jgi:hypothetical protein
LIISWSRCFLSIWISKLNSLRSSNTEFLSVSEIGIVSVLQVILTWSWIILHWIKIISQFSTHTIPRTFLYHTFVRILSTSRKMWSISIDHSFSTFSTKFPLRSRIFGHFIIWLVCTWILLEKLSLLKA